MTESTSSGLTDPKKSFFGIVLWVILAVLWFAMLDYRDLNEPDEGRYAEIPREMFASGDWLTPRLDGFKYFEKPPMQYWATAVFYQLLGPSAATSRLWSALMGFVGILSVIWVGKRLFGPAAGWYSGLVLTSMILYVAMAHFNTLDMSTSVWLMLGMGALLLAQSRREEDPGSCRNYMLLGWAALAGACLSKGVIGLVLPGATLVLYSVWQRDWGLWRHLHLGWGILLFLALTAPWFVGVSLANPEFPHFFFIHEHLERYTTTTHGRTGVWWYFLGVLLLGTVPWSRRVLAVLFKPGFAWGKGTGRFDPVRLMWVNVVFIVFFFSISQSKLIPYILPAFPILALLLGRDLAMDKTRLTLGWETRLLAILAVLLCVGAINIHVFVNEVRPAEMLVQARPWLLGAASVLAVAVGVSLWLRCQGGTVLISLVVATLLTGQLILWGAQVFSPTNSSRNAAKAISSIGNATTPVYFVNCYFQSLPFYLGRTILLVEYMGELEFGIRQEPATWIADKVTFNQRWLRETQAVAVFRLDDFAVWRTNGLPMRVVHEDTRRVVVARQ
ncbi:MAG: glycosyltransferase family 39 protein [Magnetococcus sp. YQC-5]